MPSRGELDEGQARVLNEQVPEAVSIQRRVLALNPVRVEFIYGPGTSKGESAVCLQDAAEFLTEARYALAEAHAHWLWHTSTDRSPAVKAVLSWAQFYLDDAILRMYAAGESVAAFLDIELDSRAIKRSSGLKVRGTSRLVRLDNLLQSIGAKPDMATQVSSVASNESWLFVKDYRDKWVHEQRPRIQGLGISYRRQRRWKRDKADKTGNTWVLGIGGGDPPDLTIDEFFAKSDEAYRVLRALVEECCVRLEQELSTRERRFPYRLEADVESGDERPETTGTRVVDQDIDSSV